MVSELVFWASEIYQKRKLEEAVFESSSVLKTSSISGEFQVCCLSGWLINSRRSFR